MAQLSVRAASCHLLTCQPPHTRSRVAHGVTHGVAHGVTHGDTLPAQHRGTGTTPRGATPRQPRHTAPRRAPPATAHSTVGHGVALRTCMPTRRCARTWRATHAYAHVHARVHPRAHVHLHTCHICISTYLANSRPFNSQLTQRIRELRLPEHIHVHIPACRSVCPSSVTVAPHYACTCTCTCASTCTCACAGAYTCTCT